MKWRSHHGQQKSLKCSTWMQSQKRQIRFQGKPFNITVIQVYAPTSNTEEAEIERFYEDTRKRQWHPTSVLLPRKSHGQRGLVGCSPWGR